MKTLWIQKTAMLGVTLSITLATALAGCGGAATQSSDAVTAPDPTAVAASKSAAAPTTTRIARDDSYFGQLIVNGSRDCGRLGHAQRPGTLEW